MIPRALSARRIENPRCLRERESMSDSTTSIKFVKLDRKLSPPAKPAGPSGIFVNPALVAWLSELSDGRVTLHFAGEPIGSPGVTVEGPLGDVEAKLHGLS